MNSYTDEYLEHYGDRYRERKLYEHGVTFVQYLANPEACEQVIERNVAAERAPEPLLLPQQISQAARELERGMEACPKRNGIFIEPLHHRRFPRWGGSMFRRKTA